jgi:hypothetical protein
MAALDKPDLAAELKRAQDRRRTLGIQRPTGHADRPWALCLSGGGIRSATFCLGALQGLALSPPPPTGPSEKLSAGADTPVASSLGLLAQFDAVSTVSGGGYIGGFFSSLFVTGRLEGTTENTGASLTASPTASAADAAAARLAYAVLQEEPPQRLRSTTTYEPGRPGRAALAWLRDNGRYLTPSGAGDLVYAAAVGIRNWFAAHYVVATLTLLVLLLSLIARLAAVVLCGHPGEARLLPHTGVGIWWSSTWYAAAGLLLALAVPLGIGFWFTHPRPGDDVNAHPTPATHAAAVSLVLAATLLLLGTWLRSLGKDQAVGSLVSLVAGTLTTLGVISFAVLAFTHRETSISALRVTMTRKLRTTLLYALALAALASAETLAQTASVHLGRGSLLPTGGAVTALVWLTRFIAQRMSEKQGASLPRKIPFGTLAGLAGAALWLVIVAAFDLLLLWIVANGNPHGEFPFSDNSAPAALRRASVLALIVLAIAVITGQFQGFLNLSTFQGLYSARLTRAYLGASNHKRFAKGETSVKQHNVAEPAEGDNLTVERLHANPCAPVHYINVCVNQTIGPGEQLVQRDRKGKPLVVAPGGFYLDGVPHRFPGIASSPNGELDAQLTVGEWVGVSGAAFTTGLGRSTSLGTSLLLGFANVRLGRWWRSGIENPTSKARGLRRIFGTQIYLLDEIRAMFRGTRLPYLYLSDGGHFENTACYEMLRPGRDVALTVVCDCGADPGYEFDDLANLMRLARIDHGVEVSVNREIANHPVLGRHFGTPEHFMRRADGTLPTASERCAMLLDIRSMSRAGEMSLSGRIVLLKPTLLASAPADVVNYHARHPAFPQEPTSDQFFDEAQWESYRKLGLEVARRVFPQIGDDDYAQVFWNAVRAP